jgi:hypothetical protein
MTTVVSTVSLAPTQAPLAPATGAATKRKASVGGPNAVKRTKTVRKAVVKKKTAAAKKVKNDTPNPLKVVPAPVASAPIAAKPAAAKTVPVKTTVARPAVSACSSPSTSVSKSIKPALKITAPQNVAPAPVLSSTPTEADFKNVAQAAVSNLIMNASGGKSETTKAADSAGKIDTSTDHVKALTGSNWVSVCSGGDSPSSSNQASADKMNNRSRRQNLTPDERARQNRDRNREHARNTRLRKKAYVEELKRTLTALVAQRDAADLEKRHASQRELEQREVRFRVTEEFLKLRGRNEANPARWAAILEDGFTLTLPITDFRGMVHSGETNHQQRFEQVLTGVPEIMNDSNLCSAFLQGLGKGHGDVTLVYDCDRKNFFMDNCTAMLEFTATSHGAVQQGAVSELSMKGNVRAKFSPASNKLISVVMTFDTGVIMSQANHITQATEHEVDAAAAAQVAASEADAILDSLQMPHIAAPSIPSKINVVPPSSGSTTGSSICEKEDPSDSSDKEEDQDGEGMSTRRVLRRKD